MNLNHTINVLFTDMHNGLFVLNNGLRKNVTDFGATMIDLWGKIKSAKYVLLGYSPTKWMGVVGKISIYN